MTRAELAQPRPLPECLSAQKTAQNDQRRRPALQNSRFHGISAIDGHRHAFRYHEGVGLVLRKKTRCSTLSLGYKTRLQTLLFSRMHYLYKRR